MHIQTLHLQNFRGFEEKKITFHPQFNVLIGENGSGKTTILDSIAYLLKDYNSRLCNESKFEFREIDRRYKRFEESIEFTKEPTKLTLNVSDFFQKEDTLTIEIAQNKTKNVYQNPIKQLSEKIEDLVVSGSKANIPIIAYYPSLRLSSFVEKLSPDTFEFNGARAVGYDNGLENKPINSNILIARIKALELAEFQQKKTLETLQAIKRAMIQSIPHCVNVYFDYKWGELIVEYDNDTRDIFSALSDGYRNVLAIFGDIAYRAARLNPYAINILTETRGIVMIDEIDLHLHPKWQVKIVDYLRNTFPNIQFIVTTHSPLIIQEMKKEPIIFLDETSDYEPNLLTPDSILMRIQGLDDVETPERNIFF